MVKPRILFVDDSIDVYGTRLEEVCPSFEIIPEKNPRLALERFRFSEIQPDFIVLDLNFQHLEDEVNKDFPKKEDVRVLGVHLLEILRRMDPDIPIVMLSGYGDLTSAFGAGHSGANAFYTKEEALKEDDPKKGTKNIFQAQLQVVLNASRYTYDRKQQVIADRVADQYRTLEASSPGTVAYWHFEEQKLIDTIRSILKSKVAKNSKVEVLDIGVGDGRNPAVLFREFPGRVHVTGIDFSGKMLDNCRKQFDKEMKSGDMRSRAVHRRTTALRRSFFRCHHRGLWIPILLDIDPRS